MEQSNIISGSDAERCGLSVVNPDTGLTSNQEQCAIMLASGVSITEVSKQISENASKQIDKYAKTFADNVRQALNAIDWSAFVKVS